MTFFHGGAPGLASGDQLLPPRSTGVKGAGRSDRVYFGVDGHGRERARFQAVCSYGGRGSLYSVQPSGEIERDPEEPGALMTTRAVVVDVLERNVARWHGMTADQIFDWGWEQGGWRTRPTNVEAIAVAWWVSLGHDPRESARIATARFGSLRSRG